MKKKTIIIFSSFVLPLVVLFILLSASACNDPSSKNLSPNLVIVLVDTLRSDHCSVYGYKHKTTPNLERIAKSGLKLENFFANAPWTKPSVASILTGLYPTAHGSRKGQFEDIENSYLGSPSVEILSPNIRTMAEVLKAKGFSTHAYVTNYHMTPDFGYAQGYDHYNFDPDGAEDRVVCKKDKQMMQDAMKTLESHKKPVFIWCHLMSVHNYQSPADFKQFKPESATPIPANAEQVDMIPPYKTIEEAVCDYDNSILYVDRLIGEFYDSIIAKEPNTVFIVMSDHGEEFYDHGGFEHCRTLYNELLKVPCIIHGPGVPVGVYSELADTIDLLPTIMNQMGIKIFKGLRGQILYNDSQIIKQEDLKKKEVFSEKHQRGLHIMFSLLRNGQKMILNRSKGTGEVTLEFYNNALAVEKENVIDQTDERTIKRFKRKINRYRSFARAYFKHKVGKAAFKTLSQKDIRQLRSLGYIQ